MRAEQSGADDADETLGEAVVRTVWSKEWDNDRDRAYNDMPVRVCPDCGKVVGPDDPYDHQFGVQAGEQYLACPVTGYVVPFGPESP